MSNNMKNKKKKEKITYIDDGRTIADMSGVSGGLSSGKKTKKKTVNGVTPLGTYLSAVKMMFVPMLFVLGFILVAYMLMSLIFLLI